MFQLIDHIKKTNLMDEIFIGIVVDNDDPLKLGRVRVKIPNLYEPSTLENGELDFSGIPWAIPKNPLISGGASPSGGVFSVPSLYQEVEVNFPTKDVYHPAYTSTVMSYRARHSIFDSNYPNAYGLLDTVGNWIKVDKENGSFEIFLKNGFKFVLYADGNVGINYPKNVYYNVEGLEYRTYQQGVNQLVNNLANIIGLVGKGFENLFRDKIQTSLFKSSSTIDNTVIDFSGAMGGVGMSRVFTDQFSRLKGGNALEDILLDIKDQIQGVVDDYPGGLKGYVDVLKQRGLVTRDVKTLPELINELNATTGNYGFLELVKNLPKGVYTLFDYMENGISSWIQNYPDIRLDASNIVVNDVTLLLNAFLTPRRGPYGARPDEALNAINDMNLIELFNRGYDVNYIAGVVSELPDLKYIPQIPPDPPGTVENPLDVTGYSGCGPAVFNLIVSGVSGSEISGAINQILSGGEIRKTYALNVFSGIDVSYLLSKGYTFSDITNYITNISNLFADIIEYQSAVETVKLNGTILGSGIFEFLKIDLVEPGSSEYFFNTLFNKITSQPSLGNFSPYKLLILSGGLKLSELQYLGISVFDVTNHIVSLLDTVSYTSWISIIDSGIGLGDILRTGIDLGVLNNLYLSLIRPGFNPVYIPSAMEGEPPTPVYEGLYVNSMFSGSSTEIKVRQFLNNVDNQLHRCSDILTEDLKVRLENKVLAETHYDDMLRIGS